MASGVILGLVVIGPIWLALYLYGPSLRDAIFAQPEAKNQVVRWIVAAMIFIVALIYSIVASQLLLSMLGFEIELRGGNPVPSFIAAIIGYYRTGPNAIDQFASPVKDKLLALSPSDENLVHRGLRSSRLSVTDDDLPLPPSHPQILTLEEEILEFSEAELALYDESHLTVLYENIRGNEKSSLAAICKTICKKIGREEYQGCPRHFLREYYKQLHRRLTAPDEVRGKARVDR